MSDTTSAQSLPSTQRIDKWLWCVRFFKTRSLAGKAVAGGGMRLTRNDQTLRLSKPGFTVQAEDVIAFNKGPKLFVIKVLACAVRRGPATEAQTLYEDLSPPPPPKKEKPITPAPAFEREKGTGRPTKKDRRALNNIRIQQQD
jgi:ribosome-associated heat shock protein Hsp15